MFSLDSSLLLAILISDYSRKEEKIFDVECAQGGIKIARI